MGPNDSVPVCPKTLEVPVVAGDFALGGGERPAGVSGEGVGETDEAEVGLLGDHVGAERVHLLAAQVVDHGPQVGFFGLDPFGKAALGEPVEDLGHDEGIQAAQAHLAADRKSVV